jgi:hypothetical protein
MLVYLFRHREQLERPASRPMGFRASSWVVMHLSAAAHLCDFARGNLRFSAAPGGTTDMQIDTSNTTSRFVLPCLDLPFKHINKVCRYSFINQILHRDAGSSKLTTFLIIRAPVSARVPSLESEPAIPSSDSSPPEGLIMHKSTKG